MWFLGDEHPPSTNNVARVVPNTTKRKQTKSVLKQMAPKKRRSLTASLTAALRRQIPVTLLSGFLGSGKTSLLRHVLHNKEGLRVAVILNEISEINIDVLALQGAKLMQANETVVEMSNGCICCTLREDLLKTLRDIHEGQQFDAVLIESSGIAEPLQTAETFFIRTSEAEDVLQHATPLDNCITVVDASTFKGYLNDARAAHLIDPKGKDEKEDQSIGELLLQQVEFANTVVLNKIDLLVGGKSSAPADDPQQHPAVAEVMALIRSINPTAVVLCSVNSVVPLSQVLQTSRFSEKWATGVAGWMDDLREGGVQHTPETLEYGIGSYLYTADRPFHPQRLYDWMDAHFFWNEVALEEVEEPDSDEEEEAAVGGSYPAAPHNGHHHHHHGTPCTAADEEKLVVFGEEERAKRDAAYGNFFRSKGYIWIGNPDRVDHVVEWSQAGTVLTFQYGGPWYDFFGEGSKRRVREQRLVFLGQNLNKDALKRDLDALLLTDGEWAALQAGDLDSKPLADPFEPFPPSAVQEARERRLSEEKKKGSGGTRKKRPRDA